MKHVVPLSIALLGAVSMAVPADAKEVAGGPVKCETVTEDQVALLFDRWNDSLLTGDPDKVVSNYAEDGVLLATVSNQPRTTPASIHNYFVKFLKGKPTGAIDERFIKLGCNLAQDVGTYTFRFADGSTVKARYTYVYEWNGGDWLISHHHSSAMPEG